MRALLQRVAKASVRVSGEERVIGRGLLILLGIGQNDDEPTGKRLAEKLVGLRVFPDEGGRFDRSVLDVGGSALVVSQFTLYGDCSRGRRPDFGAAMPPYKAEPLYRSFVRDLQALGVPVRTGDFGAHMEVELVNDGPVTLWVDTDR